MLWAFAFYLFFREKGLSREWHTSNGSQYRPSTLPGIGKKKNWNRQDRSISSDLMSLCCRNLANKSYHYHVKCMRKSAYFIGHNTLPELQTGPNTRKDITGTRKKNRESCVPLLVTCDHVTKKVQSTWWTHTHVVSSEFFKASRPLLETWGDVR